MTNKDKTVVECMAHNDFPLKYPLLKVSSKQILRSQEKANASEADQLTSAKKPRQRIDGVTKMKKEATYGHLFIATFSILKGDKAWVEAVFGPYD